MNDSHAEFLEDIQRKAEAEALRSNYHIGTWCAPYKDASLRIGCRVKFNGRGGGRATWHIGLSSRSRIDFNFESRACRAECLRYMSMADNGGIQ